MMAGGGTRISQFSVKVDDYVRFTDTNIQPRYRDEWWKVTNITNNRRLDTTTYELINAEGCTGRFTATKAVRVHRHPYSQKLATA
jgi:hypothetical protein